MIQINRPMPKTCSECFGFDDNGDYPTCIINHCSKGYTFRYMEKRMDDCPLVEVYSDYKDLANVLSNWIGTPEERMAKMGQYTVYMLGCLCDEVQALRKEIK